MTKNVTDENYKEVLTSSNYVLIDFWAPWCGPCTAMSGKVDQLYEDYKGKILVGKANIDTASEFTSSQGISGIPAFILFRDGKKISSITGSRTLIDMKNWIDTSIL